MQDDLDCEHSKIKGIITDDVILCRRLFVEGWPVVLASESIENVCGIKGAILAGNGVGYIGLIHKDDRARVMRSLKSQIVADTFSISPYRLTFPDGKHSWVQEKGEFCRNDTGRVVYMNSVITEVPIVDEFSSQIKALQQRIAALEEERALKEHAFMLLNDSKGGGDKHLFFKETFPAVFKSFLSKITSLSQMMKNENLSSGMQDRLLCNIKEKADVLSSKVDEYVDFVCIDSNPDLYPVENVCLNGLFDDLDTLFKLKGDSVRVPLFIRSVMTDKESTVFSNRKLLLGVLNALLKNAFKYTYSGFVELSAAVVDGECVIAVKDTGGGIDEDSQEMIFNEFFKLNKLESGLGLGLPVAKQYASILGGEISLVSNKYGGSVFSLKIPYSPVFAENKGDENHSGKIDADEFCVLVAEDEEINFLYIETVLSNISIPCRLIHARNGAEAVRFCDEFSDIDLVLMDLKMPEMNGFEATSIIKQRHPALKIVIQSAYSGSSDRRRAVKAGSDDFLTKPISKEVLSELVYRCKTTCKL